MLVLFKLYVDFILTHNKKRSQPKMLKLEEYFNIQNQFLKIMCLVVYLVFIYSHSYFITT